MRNYLLVSTAMAAVFPGLAAAQDRPAPTATNATAPEEQANSSTGLQDIIVTAQRQREDAQRAAVAIDVLRGNALIAAGVTQVEGLSKLSPSLSISNSGTGPILFLRGVGNFTISPNSDPAIAFSYDGVYLGRPSSTSGLFYDLERVELLKGPQGTLYGRNATGGAINVIPAEPRIGELSGYASASYGNYNALTAEAAVNLPLDDRSALRISGNLVDRDGYLHDGTSDDRTKSVRVQLKVKLTPDLTVRLAGDYSHTGGRGTGASYLGNYVFNPVSHRYVFAATDMRADGVFSPDAQAYRTTVRAGTAGRRLDPLAPSPSADNSFYGVNAQIDYDTGAGVLTVVPAWREAELDLITGVASFPYHQREQDQQVSVEARFAGRQIGPIGYTIGAYYFDESIKQRTSLSLSSALSLLDQRFSTKSYAMFGRLTAHISDQLRLVGGARYTNDRKQVTGTTTSAALICTRIVAGIPSCPNAVLFPLVDSPSQLPFAFPTTPGVAPQIIAGVPSGAIIARSDRNDNSRLGNHRVTWRAALEFDVAPRSLFYTSFETGYRSGGFSPAVGFETYQPEYIDAYTVGLKNRFFDNRLQLNLEGFYWKYRDQQVNHVGIDLSGRTANFTQNIGNSRIKGFELDVQALITPTTLISTNLQYLHTRNKSFLYQQAVGTPGTPPPLTSCAVRLSATNSALYDVDCAGLPSFNSPRWTLNLAGQQTIPLNGYNLTVGVNSQFKSSRYNGFFYLPEQRVGPTWQTNAELSFGPTDSHWSIAAYVRNIENQRIAAGSVIHPTANFLVANLSAPRTYGVRGSFRF
ncbi:MAG TPA: TonB-dependent receptor [Sphingobium sp.]